MNSEALKSLPPEMQQRIASIVSQGNQMPAAPAQPAPPAAPPVTKSPSLMDHLLALRQEVDMLRNEQRVLTDQIAANSNVVEAVGQAVGQMYQMFQTTPNQASTYSASFQNQPVEQDGADY